MPGVPNDWRGSFDLEAAPARPQRDRGRHGDRRRAQRLEESERLFVCCRRALLSRHAAGPAGAWWAAVAEYPHAAPGTVRELQSTLSSNFQRANRFSTLNVAMRTVAMRCLSLCPA